MHRTPGNLTLDEAAARRIVLAQAIDEADRDARLVSSLERREIDRASADAARSGGAEDDAIVAPFLRTRAERILATAGQREPAVLSLQESGAGERWLARGLPLAALVLGVFTDQIANPHQVNLLSKPLLLLLLWNIVVYLVLLVSYMLSREKPGAVPRTAPLRRWIAGVAARGASTRRLRGELASSFLLHWHALTAGLYARRLARVLHLAAAAWALGVALSLFFGGVWASYSVQWESTFLSAQDVHRFLGFVFKPVTALFPWASFSLEEVRSLRAAGPLAMPPAAENFTGRRWVFLYAMLLALVVMLPRLLLAAFAGWQERKLSREIELDLRGSYYQRILASLHPTRVELGLYTHRPEDRAALLRVLLRGADARMKAAEEGPLLTVDTGEELRWLELPELRSAAFLRPDDAQGTAWTRFLRRVSGSGMRAPDPAGRLLKAARERVDLVLHVVSERADLQSGAAAIAWLDRPVLLLVNASEDDPAAADLLAVCRSHAGIAPVREVLAFDEFARCWAQERVLLGAIGANLPEHQAQGFGRIDRAWDERHRADLRESMTLLATHLLSSASDVGDVAREPRSLVSLVRPLAREAHEQRTREAKAAVVERVQHSQAQATSKLIALYGVDGLSWGALNHALEEKFVVQDAISASQAGMAGAATGAAMGVSIDLLTAGLTLGLAAAAGAVVGGGAAWVAAVWKNQATPAGTSAVQLSEDMMQALVEAALLHYLAVIHYGRDPTGADSDIRRGWRSEVVLAVEHRSDELKEQWALARARKEALDPVAALASMLESMTLGVLQQLYPESATVRETRSPSPR